MPEGTLIVRFRCETKEEYENTLKTMRRLLTKLWLISQKRIDDLKTYDETGDPRFEHEAEHAGNRITTSSEEQ